MSVTPVGLLLCSEISLRYWVFDVLGFELNGPGIESLKVLEKSSLMSKFQIAIRTKFM
jgi:hypothetical protein